MQIKVKNPTGNRIDNPGKVLLFILNDGTSWSNSRTPFTEKNLPVIGAAGTMVTVMFDRAYDVRANVGSEIEFLVVLPPVRSEEFDRTYKYNYLRDCTFEKEQKTLLDPRRKKP